MSPWEYVGTNAEANNLFNKALACHTKDIMASVVKMYDGFRSVRTVVDVGGGLGSALSVIVAQYPHIQGINFDLPRVIATASHIPVALTEEGLVTPNHECAHVVDEHHDYLYVMSSELLRIFYGELSVKLRFAQNIVCSGKSEGYHGRVEVTTPEAILLGVFLRDAMVVFSILEAVVHGWWMF
ncbi:caffeic acid 3-O-methyltransferase-like [Cryptomeria japonica]|uniref:caffeic acid 3-O-methyltransferase-like n=1 Tax=Cryptomeria japonica TaxID=3369 RepID=UPI0027DA4E74|nr:caffeic acid 3-O-methyltransferase-like [Cryptomeria japonica]